MAVTIVKVEKMYPDFLLYLSTGKHYTARIIEVAGDKRIEYLSLVGKPLKNCPFISSRIWEYLNLINYTNWSKAWEYFDTLSSLPDFDFGKLDMSAYSFRGFIDNIEGYVSKRQFTKLFQQFGYNLFNPVGNDVYATILSALYPLSEEEQFVYSRFFNTDVNINLKIKFHTDKKFRHLFMRAIENPAAAYIPNPTIIRLVNQFLENCKSLGIKPPTGDPWKNFKIISETVEQKRKEEEEKKFKEVQTEYNLTFEDDNFTVIVPTTYRECADEGAAMHNCVGGHEWNEFLKTGTRRIVFIRRKSNINMPYIDLDMTLQCNPCQIRSSHNTLEWKHNEQAVKFIKAYIAYLETLVK